MSTSGPEPDEGAATGLTSEEASARRQEFGPNEAAPRDNSSTAAELLRLFASPLVLILLMAAIISAFLGEALDAGIIIGIVLLSVGVDFAQTYRSTRAIRHLREQVAPTATVLRDGSWQDVSRADVVPGDVARLAAGDLVPADARLLASRDLFVQQAALTGESLPVEKQATSAAASGRPDAANMVFLGSSVVSGTATILIVSTGARTAFGDVASRLAARPEDTAFDRGLKGFSLLLARTVLFLVVFLLGVSLLLHRDALQSLLFAVALAVGLTPEFLPMITSVTLSQGARAMAAKKVIVKHLSAIQNFGSIDVLCSDKTGTLTSGQMVLDGSLDPFGRPSERCLMLAHLNSRMETGIRSPLDAAILQCPEPADANGYQKCDELPYDFERRRLSVVAERAGERWLITKGSPEGILPLLSAVELGGQIPPLDDATLARCAATHQGLSAQGFRTLAVAYSKVPVRPDYSVADERDLTLAGFLSFTDPARPDAAEALTALQRDGVEVKVITGDGELVTEHVCRAVGLDPGKIVTGDELDHVSDAALGPLAETTTIFVRVSPAQKNRILLALKHRGHVVGFMGDGINDAPSLHAADVGISVSSAVDVARDAADIILLEPGLAVLHDGIVEGRKAFGNVMKYLLMGTSSNFGNMFSMAAGSIVLPFLPMLPMQILLNNFMYDSAQITIPTDHLDPEYLRKPQHWDVRLIRNFMLLVGPISSVFDFLTFYVLLAVFRAGDAMFHTGWFIESLATQTLVIFVIRTAGNPLRNRPSLPLTGTTLGVVAVAIALPFTPLGGLLGFVPLPARYFVFLVGATAAYLLLVGAARRRLLGGGGLLRAR